MKMDAGSVMADIGEWANRSGLPPDGLRRVLKMIGTPSSQRQYRFPDQRPALYMSELSARPWHSPNDFSWIPSLEGSFDAIIREYRQLQKSAVMQRHPEAPQLVNGTWNILPLFSFGIKNEVNCALVPSTVDSVAAVPGASTASLVYLSLLAPHTHIAPHCGPTNLRLRCHLGIEIPETCGIRVSSERRIWEPGKCILFDDSFEHEVWNDSPHQRAVLIVDFWHPDLSEVEQHAIQYLTGRLMDAGVFKGR
jgi:aspartyl/asparaginyl beta-hydroxylase (cupin superfamily)